MKIIFATHNQGKLIEMKKILAGLDVLGIEEIGIMEDVEEDGKTFEENALKKARFIFDKIDNNFNSGKYCIIADDSGLCIKALDGMPGVFSARWSGGRNIVDFTLEKMKNIPDGQREAWFETAAALIDFNGKEMIFSGRMHGKIVFEPRGVPLPKLPYDSIFIPNGLKKTVAEISEDEKNSMSQRGQAFSALKKYIQTELM